MTGTRYEVVNLSIPPNHILSGDITVDQQRLEFIQPVDLWTLYFYQHSNSLTINSRTYSLHPNDIGIVPPGARVSHGRVGEGTEVNFLTFDMPGVGGTRGAVPHVLRDMSATRVQWIVAGNHLMESTVFMKAYAWNFMCQAAQNMAVIRSETLLYDAEEWIRVNLDRRFTITEMCESLGSSPRHLLRSFRVEHGMTVQEYVIRKRIQEAARLLVATDLPAKQIADRVGIPDLQHFNKLMRQYTGVAPREFRTKSDLGFWR